MINKERCHCCNAYASNCDDFGYHCQTCHGRHCSYCLSSFDYPCEKCREKNVNAKCVACKKKPLRAWKLHKHHIEWKRFGYPDKAPTIDLCTKHHGDLHRWIEHEAIKMCIENDAKFFINKTEEYMGNLK